MPTQTPTQTPTSHTNYLDEALSLIVAERHRQEGFVKSGKFAATCSKPFMSPLVRLAVLSEEVGEYAKELNESPTERRIPTINVGHPSFTMADMVKAKNEWRQRCIDELTQVAAVACAAVEGILAEKYSGLEVAA